MAGETGSTFTCKCGKHQGWIYEGVEKEDPCPGCGRRYKGVYSRRKLSVDAVEIRPASNNLFKLIRRWLTT